MTYGGIIFHSDDYIALAISHPGEIVKLYWWLKVPSYIIRITYCTDHKSYGWDSLVIQMTCGCSDVCGNRQYWFELVCGLALKGHQANDKGRRVFTESSEANAVHPMKSLRWRHNESDGGSNHQPHDCLLNRLFRRRSKETSKLRVTGLCVGNSPVTGEFPAQRASNAENVSIWWRHHDMLTVLSFFL